MDADDIIKLLELAPHPEAAYYRETYRDAGGADGRAWSTAIYFLLKEGQKSRWHRVDAAGDLALVRRGAFGPRDSDGRGYARIDLALGPGLASGERPQAIAPPGAWQQAESPGRVDARRLHGRARVPVFSVRDRGPGI